MYEHQIQKTEEVAAAKINCCEAVKNKQIELMNETIESERAKKEYFKG